jgi:hypothetical protein
MQQEGQRGSQQGGSGGGAFPGVTPGGHQIPSGVSQGQQPILNVSELSSFVNDGRASGNMAGDGHLHHTYACIHKHLSLLTLHTPVLNVTRACLFAALACEKWMIR